jgi:hypothetical protein
MIYVLYMTSPSSIDLVLFERILQTAVSASAIDQLCQKHNLKVRRGIYSLAVVIWLMIYQRLHRKGTLSAAVHFLARQAVHWQGQPQMGKRVREDRISIRVGIVGQLLEFHAEGVSPRQKLSTKAWFTITDAAPGVAGRLGLCVLPRPKPHRVPRRCAGVCYTDTGWFLTTPH